MRLVLTRIREDSYWIFTSSVKWTQMKYTNAGQVIFGLFICLTVGNLQCGFFVTAELNVSFF